MPVSFLEAEFDQEFKKFVALERPLQVRALIHFKTQNYYHENQQNDAFVVHFCLKIWQLTG
jgi:hypothetical protein